MVNCIMSTKKNWKNDPNRKHDPEFWREISVSNCKICGGTGYLERDEISHSRSSCRCDKMVKFYVRMNDTEYGLRPEYHGRECSINNLSHLTSESVSFIKAYKCDLLSKNPYRDAIISGYRDTQKGKVAGVIYKILMENERYVSIVQFSELAKLARYYTYNPELYNKDESQEFYDLLKNEEFLIIEDVDDRLISQKIGYDLLDGMFSNRAKHTNQATIITVDNSVRITESTMGPVFFNYIYMGYEREKISMKIKLTSKFAKNNSVNLEGIIA